jgi:hypothetical protein
MKNAVFWDVAPCRSCVNRLFGRTHRFHLQGRKIRARETSGSRWLQTDTCSLWFIASGFFYPEDGGDTFLQNIGSHKIYTAPSHLLTLVSRPRTLKMEAKRRFIEDLHGATSQKTAF